MKVAPLSVVIAFVCQRKQTTREASLNLPPNLLGHKSLMIGLILIARQVAGLLKVDLDASFAEICRSADANRTSAYEQSRRILALLLELAEARPV